MRRIVPALILLGGVAACDPTGNTDVSSAAAHVRVVNLVSDAPSVTVSTAGSNAASGVAFGQVSASRLVGVEDDVFTSIRVSDNFVMGVDTVAMTTRRRYTFYVLGTVSEHKAKLAQDDTTFGAAGVFKLRFVHGSQTNKLSGLDLYVSGVSDTLTNIDPVVPSLAYGSSSPYITTDTALKRIRVTLVGQTTTLLDTTLTSAVADSNNVTLVVSDKQGGGTPMRLQMVVDKAP